MTQERSDILHCFWQWQVGNEINFSLVDLDTVLRNNMAQDNSSFHHEMTLLPIQNKILLLTSH